MRGKDISRRPAPLDEFFFSGYGRPAFFFQIFFSKVRAIISAFHLPGKRSSFFYIILPPVVGGAIQDTPRQTAQTVPFL